MKKVSSLSVFYNGSKGKKLIGNLALYKNQFAAFQYSQEWINNGFSISPFSLPLESDRVFIPDWEPFGGIFGVFNDSLPDGWGRLLVDRMLKKHNINPEELSVLDRLAIVGNNGMGALSYEPESFFANEYELPFNLDEISLECSRILNNKDDTLSMESIDSLFTAGGSSGGARPKILTKINNEDWIIKFPSSYDPQDIGFQEYQYNLCAKKCRINISDIRLFESNICKGYFGTKRFDRIYSPSGIRRIHMVSASALLETSHRIPNLDYNTLMQITLKLSHNMKEMENLFRLMCFNVFAHNRDDHSKNFTWIYDETLKEWKLSPAYDLTYSNSIGGEHATTINGEGKNPQLKDIIAVAKKNGINTNTAKEIANEINEIVFTDLKTMI